MLKIVILFFAVQIAICWERNPSEHSDAVWQSILNNSDAPEDSFIYPGTKWCGSGNNSKNYDDLGTQVETDKCCRAHDLCPDYIAAGDTKHNLKNEASYTRLDCHCDQDFHDCLHKANTTTASSVGGVYFDYLGTQCYKKDYPIVSCKKNQTGFWSNKCLEYEQDDTKEPIYQWFDVPNFD